MTLKPPSWKKLFCNFDVVLLNQVGVKNRILVSPGLKERQCLRQTFQVEVWEALEAFQVQMVDRRCSSVEVRYPLEGDHSTWVEGHYPSVEGHYPSEGHHCPLVGDHD